MPLEFGPSAGVSHGEPHRGVRSLGGWRALSATTTIETSLTDRNHFFLRRLHSLTGIIPVGAFLVEHLLTNSRAFNWFGAFSGGRDAFNEDVHWIHHLPYLLIVETLFIFAPLAFHSLYG